MAERTLKTPVGAENFRAPGRFILTKEPQSIFIDSQGTSRRRKPGSPHRDEFTEPPKPERLASLREAIPQLFAPTESVDRAEITEAFGVTEAEIGSAVNDYVTSTIGGAETRSEAYEIWKGLLLPFYTKIKEGLIANDPERVAEVRRNPLLQAIVMARADIGIVRPLDFQEAPDVIRPPGGGARSSEVGIDKDARILTLWSGTELDDLERLTDLSRLSVRTYATLLRGRGFDLEKKTGGPPPDRRRRSVAKTRRLRQEVIARWGQPNRRIAEALGMSEKQFGRFLQEMRADGIELPDKAGGREAMIKRELRANPDTPVEELAAQWGISADEVEALRDRPEPHMTQTDSQQVEMVKNLLARGFSTKQAAAIMGISYVTARYLAEHIPREEKREMGVRPGRRPPPTQEEWAERLSGLDALGFSPQEAAARLRAAGIDVPTGEITVFSASTDNPDSADDTSGAWVVGRSHTSSGSKSTPSGRPRVEMRGNGGAVHEVSSDDGETQSDSQGNGRE